jgi:hypothetical protein
MDNSKQCNSQEREEVEESHSQDDGSDDRLQNDSNSVAESSSSFAVNPVDQDNETSRARCKREDDGPAIEQSYYRSPLPTKRHREAEWTASGGTAEEGISSTAAFLPSVDSSRLLSEPDQVQAEFEVTLQTLSNRYSQLQHQLHQQQQQQRQPAPGLATSRGAAPSATQGCMRESLAVRSLQQKNLVIELSIVENPPLHDSEGRQSAGGGQANHSRVDDVATQANSSAHANPPSHSRTASDSEDPPISQKTTDGEPKD